MIRLGVVHFNRPGLHPAVLTLLLKRTRSSVAAAQNDMQGVRTFEEIPGPKALPLIGNTWRYLPFIGEYANLGMDGLVNHIREKYGNIAKVTHLHGINDMVFVFDPKDVENLFRNEGAWPRRPGVNSVLYYREELRKDFYNGVDGAFFTQGKKWYDFRSKVNQTMMQPRSSKLYVKPIDEVTNELVDRMRNLRNENGELPENFTEYLMRWALESISVVALDTRLGCLDPDLKPDSETEKMINAVHYLIHAMFELDVKKSFRHFTKRKEWKKLVEVSDFINEVSMKHVRKAMERIKNKVEMDEKELSVLETLLIKNEDPMIATVMALDMMLAGIDTTSNSTAVALHFLATNQDKQEKLFKELESILPSKDQPLTAKNLEDMKYMKACIKESMRISPIVSGTARETQKDIVLSNYLVPKGAMVIVPTKSMCLDEQNFPQPTRFIPERWIKGSEEQQTAHPFVFIPFGFGARMCLGRRFAELEMGILLARVVRNFRLEYDQELKIRSTLINNMISPLNLKLEERPS
ncbi:probable cytochrome P450 49a1 [Anabrus simplex]|uniref:probable cytochrome P450 49a1 n=1 Tax=Anabrus simplex TaxID=316456 RepID=UPI0035A38528